MAADAVLARPRGLAAAIAPLTLGHLGTDLAQGALPALLPYLATRFDLSYLQVGVLVLCSTVANSIVQPFFGHWSDRRGATWLLPAGPLTAGVGIGLLAIAPNYPAAIACVILSGVGVAAYHPEATKHAAWIARDRPSTAMSLFSIGGNLGVALGPLARGLRRRALRPARRRAARDPGRDRVGADVREPSAARHRRRRRRERRAAEAPPAAHVRELVILLWAVAARGYVYTGLVSFIPLLEQRVRHHGAGHGSRVLTILLATGAAGTLVFGPLADRVGRQRMLFWSFVLCVPATMLYLADSGPARPARARDLGRLPRLQLRRHDRALAGVPAGAHGHGRRSLDRALDRARRHRRDLRRRAR